MSNRMGRATRVMCVLVLGLALLALAAQSALAQVVGPRLDVFNPKQTLLNATSTINMGPATQPVMLSALGTASETGTGSGAIMTNNSTGSRSISGSGEFSPDGGGGRPPIRDPFRPPTRSPFRPLTPGDL